MTGGVGRLALWLHPVLGVLTTALAVRVATLALQSRGRGRTAARARARHRALGPWLYGLVVVSWLGGVASVWLGRPDMDVGDSGHFQIGSVIAVLFTVLLVTSWRMDADARVRALHPWIGAVGLLALGVQVFLGLQLMPR